MPGGAFNTSKFIQELGLKPVGPDEMRVRDDIQPVLIAGDLGDLTPPHVPPSAFYGSTIAAAGGLFATLEVQSLGPGGIFIESLSLISPASLTKMYVRSTSSGVSTVVPPAGVISRDAPASIVRSDDVADVGADRSLLTEGFIVFPEPMFIPKGDVFILQTFLANVAVTLGFQIREVPAAPAL